MNAIDGGSRPALIAAGGALKIPFFLTPEWLQALQTESVKARAAATVQRSVESDLTTWRGGNPSRWLASAEAGPVQADLYHHRSLVTAIGGLAGREVRPTGGQGTYSYYDQAGHYLGLHRDIPGCDLVLITCLHREQGERPSGALRIYAHSVDIALTEIDEKSPYADIDMDVCDSVLLLGGFIPHEVLPAVTGYKRYISVLCYEFV